MSETPTPETEQTDAQKRAQARGKAQTRLNEKYRDELVALTKEEAQKLGVEYAPRKSEKEKAADKVRELLAQHPELAAEFQTAAQAGSAQPDSYATGVYPPN